MPVRLYVKISVIIIYALTFIYIIGGFEQEIFNLFDACGSAEDIKWIIRIILKDVRLGIGHDFVLKIFHPDAAEFYVHSSDLKKVCISIQIITNYFNFI